MLINLYCRSLNMKKDKLEMVDMNFSKALLKATNESISHRARNNYRPYWTEGLQQLEDELTRIRWSEQLKPTSVSEPSLLNIRH